jgi:hypothetical protein
MNSRRREIEKNMQVMLDSLEETSLDVIAQSLQTIASMCNEPGQAVNLHLVEGYTCMILLAMRTESRLLALIILSGAHSCHISLDVLLCEVLY